MTRPHRHDPALAEDPVLRKQVDDLQRHWPANQDLQPPEHLDLAVLRAARAALPAGRRRAWPWTRGWIHNLATAAVVVLAVTVLLEMRQAPPREAGAPGIALPAPEAVSSGAPAPLREAATASPDAAAAAEQAPQTPQALRSLQVAPAGDEAASNAQPEPRSSPPDDSDIPDIAEWLERMERLYAQGEFTALAREVERFRAAYPDTPIPEHLQP